MKTYIAILTGVMVLAGFGVSTNAQAGNKHTQYQQEVKATVGMATPQASSWKHISRYARDKAEKSGLGGTVLPAAQELNLFPKNFRNSI